MEKIFVYNILRMEKFLLEETKIIQFIFIKHNFIFVYQDAWVIDQSQ